MSQQNYTPNTNSKHCRLCEETKPLTDFYKNALRDGDGYRSLCKDCWKFYFIDYQDRRKKYRADPVNKRRKAEYDKAYRLKNKERIAANKFVYWRTSPHIWEYQKNYSFTHRDLLARKSSRYRIVIINEARDILGGRCQLCGTTEKLEFAHLNYTWEERGINRHQEKSARQVLKDPSRFLLLCKWCHHNPEKHLKELIDLRSAEKV